MVETHTRILGIAPYDGMRTAMEQAAKGVGGLGDAGKAHDGVQAGVVLCQLDRKSVGVGLRRLLHGGAHSVVGGKSVSF